MKFMLAAAAPLDYFDGEWKNKKGTNYQS